LRRSLNGEALAIGVDRWIIPRGLCQPHQGVRPMWTFCSRSSSARHRCCRSRRRRARDRGLWQSAERTAKLVSDVNGVHGEVTWTPIRYLNKGFGQAVLAGLYRTAQVGVVTPLQDGMNLVAKEYVAAQNPENPGVLVLSKYAGAANELDAALLVNPHDIDGMARAIATAFSMPLTERRMRWEAMMTNCAATPSSSGPPISSTRCRKVSLKKAFGPIVPEPPTPWRFVRPMAACGITKA